MKFTRSLAEKTRKRLDEIGKTDIPVTRTGMWHYFLFQKDIERGVHIYPWSGKDFYYNPPIRNPRPSNRILILGTNVEIRTLTELIENPSKLEVANLHGYDDESRLYLRNVIEQIKVSEINYCRRLESFWENFFNEENFLDKSVTIPRRMTATGFMRNYNVYGFGRYCKVRERLQEIAQNYNIPIDFIKPISEITAKL